MVQNIFEMDFPDEEVFSYLNTMPRLDEDSLIRAYNLALKNKRSNVIRVLINQLGFRNYFSFSSDEDLKYFLENDKPLLLPLLYFQVRTLTYDEILYYIFKESYPRYRKRVGILFSRYGTRALNNLYILSLLIDIEKHFDDVVNFDHNLLINEYIYKCLIGVDLENGGVGRKGIFTWLVDLKFPINRIFKILVSHNNSDDEDSYSMAWDIDRMINMAKGRFGDGHLDLGSQYSGRFI